MCPDGGYFCGQQNLHVRGGGGLREAVAGLPQNSPPRGKEAGQFPPHPNSRVSLPRALLGSRPLAGDRATWEAGRTRRTVLRGPLGWTEGGLDVNSLCPREYLSHSILQTDIIHVKNLIQGLSHSKPLVSLSCNDMNDVVVIRSEVMFPLTSGPSLPAAWHTPLPTLPPPGSCLCVARIAAQSHLVGEALPVSRIRSSPLGCAQHTCLAPSFHSSQSLLSLYIYWHNGVILCSWPVSPAGPEAP